MSHDQLVNSYYQSWKDNDLATLESLLGEKFNFEGPLMRANSPQEYVEMIRSMCAKGPAMKQGKIHAKFLTEKEACVLYDCESADGKIRIPMAEHIRWDQGKISAIRVYFDSKTMAN